MKNENREARVYAVLAGVFLLLYGLISAFLMRGFFAALTLESFLTWMRYLLPGLAGLFLILRKPKVAAILMALAAVAVLLQELPEIPRYLEPNGYLANPNEEIEFAEYIPVKYVILPILSILTALCFAAALFLRGWPSLLLSLCAAAAELVYMVEQIASVAYVTGHPTPFNIFFPFNYAMGAIFAGLYMKTLTKWPFAKSATG